MLKSAHSTLRSWACCGIILMAGSCTTGEPEKMDMAAVDAPKPGAVAVVELFTSEGCSSCPPADVVLNELVADARADGVAVYPLAFHVDYWDRLGWKDPFSSARASDRQRRYARTLDTNVYTPQMVVNGRAKFVGSDRARARREIARALATPAPAKLSLRTDRKAADVTVAYSIDAAPADSVLMVVAVERGLTTRVPRGENAGKTLRHENVVRTLESIAIAKTDRAVNGQAVLRLPDDAKPDRVSIIAYLQDAASLRVLGATQSPADATPVK